MSRRTSDRLWNLLAVVFGIALLAGVILIRLAIAGGDWSCVLSADPALCIAVKGVR